MVNNAGTYNRNGQGTTQTDSAIFNNTGTVNVNDGTFRVQGGGAHSAGSINVASGATWRHSSSTFAYSGGSFVNAGTLAIDGGSATFGGACTAYSGSGAIAVSGGTGTFDGAGSIINPDSLTVSGGSARFAGTVNTPVLDFSGGSIGGSGVVNAAALNWTGGNFGISGTGGGTTNVSGNVALNSSNHDVRYGHTLNLNGTSDWAQGDGYAIYLGAGGGGTSTLGIGASGTFNDAGTTNAGATRYLGYYANGVVNNAGTYNRNGLGTTTTQNATFDNTGTVNVNGGTMQFANLQGAGTLHIAAGGIARADAANSTVGTLNHQGGAANSLILGTRTITVSTDYDNASFGTGNAFDRRANVSTSGSGPRIVAAGDVNQALSGALVSGGATATPSLVLGNVHVGTTAFGYSIDNAGTTGPALRGAIQTSVGGANIDDARLAGSGVTAGNWGPVGPGTGLAQGVNFTVATAGVYAPITGQAVRIVNNFDNTRSQLLTLGSAPGAAAYNLAQAQTITPSVINLGSGRVGDPGGPTSAALTIANVAPVGSFTEMLNAGFGVVTGDALTNGGSVSLLAAGASDSTSMVVSLANLDAGARSGTVQVTFASDGSGTSGLGITNLASQLITVQAGLYNAAVGSATPTPVTLANQRVGGSLAQALTVSNLAPAGSYSEALNAAFGSNAGNALNNGGSITDLAAGASNAAAMSVGVNTATVGAKSGSVTLNYQTDGTGPNGNSGLAAIDAGSQTINVSGNVYRLAAGSATPTPINFGSLRTGAVAQQVLTVANAAAADGYSEKLDASFGGSTGSSVALAGSITGLAAGTNDASAMSVTLATATAGAKSGSVTLDYVSNGTGTSGLANIGAGSQTIGFSGNVYQAAAAQLNTAALDFGTVQVGQAVSQQLSFTNIASGTAGFVEDLDVRFGGSSGTGAAQIIGVGGVSRLVAGATNDTSMQVQVNTATAGTINGSIALNYFSTGTVNGAATGLSELAVGSFAYGVTGTITALVINPASPVLSTTNVNLGAVRVGSASPSALIGLTNQATESPQAALNATIAAGAPITASGSVNLLAPGASNSAAFSVGMDTSTAGAKSGTAVVSLVSDASNIGGCEPNCLFTLPSQDVSVSGAVYRLANPSMPSSLHLLGRVGGVASGSLAVTNVSPDAYTERLNAAIGAASGGFTSSGSVVGLGAGGTSNALLLSMGTATAGNRSGSVSVDFVSSGVGTTGAPDAALGSQLVSLTGTVYTPAVAKVHSSTVDFGIVHVGDAVAARTVNVTNDAVIAAPNDTLRGTLGAAGGPFTSGGNLVDLAAQATDNTSFTVQLDTSAAGVFNRTAGASFSSHNAEMSDLSLGTVDIALSAQVNNYAVLGLTKAAGAGSFVQVGNLYTLDFGDVTQGAAGVLASLEIWNLAFGPSDTLGGSFTLGAGSGFSFSGLGDFSGLGASSSMAGPQIGLLTGSTGLFSQSITIAAVGSNASGYSGALESATLELRGNVVAVPEPGTYGMLTGGLLALWLTTRRRRFGAATQAV